MYNKFVSKDILYLAITLYFLNILCQNAIAIRSFLSKSVRQRYCNHHFSPRLSSLRFDSTSSTTIESSIQLKNYNESLLVRDPKYLILQSHESTNFQIPMNPISYAHSTIHRQHPFLDYALNKNDNSRDLYIYHPEDVVGDSPRALKLLAGIKGLSDIQHVNTNGIFGCFLSFRFENVMSQHDAELGKLFSDGKTRLLSYSRIKRWWMAPSFCESVDQIPVESQLLLIEISYDDDNYYHMNRMKPSRTYAVIAPLIDYSSGFRVTLFGAEGGSPAGREVLAARLESGDENVKTNHVKNAIYVASGDNPYKLMEAAYEAIATRLGTFRTRKEKPVPKGIDSFGFCTWDAFYSGVDSNKVKSAVQSLQNEGIPPKFVIIDDGWQSTALSSTKSSRNATQSQGKELSKEEKVLIVNGDNIHQVEDGELSGAQIDGKLASEKIAEDSNPIMKYVTQMASQFYIQYVETADPDSLSIRAWSILSKSVLKGKLIKFFDTQTDFSKRLTSWKANTKFEDSSQQGKTLKSFISSLKNEFGIDYVYFWHALSGYWGGVSENPEDEMHSALLLSTSSTSSSAEVVVQKNYPLISLPPSQTIKTSPSNSHKPNFEVSSRESSEIINGLHKNIPFSQTAQSSITYELSIQENLKIFPNNKEIVPSIMTSIVPVNAGANLAQHVILPVKRSYSQPTPHLLQVEPALAWDPASLAGVGSVALEKLDEMYRKIHEYLAEAGADGVKVDAQSGIGVFGTGNGGGSALAKACVTSMEKSVKNAFGKDVNLELLLLPVEEKKTMFLRFVSLMTTPMKWLSKEDKKKTRASANTSVSANGVALTGCMCHSTENLYNYFETPLTRASDDFYPKDLASQVVHIVSCAYNSVMLGEIAVTDWDMFHSKHLFADMHAAARAISGGPLYVSDVPGNHNADLLRKLVLPDGNILRTLLPARPTIDCLFDNVMRDHKSALKIWSTNKISGIVGVFNCQGSYWDRVTRKYVSEEVSANIPPLSITAKVTSLDFLKGLPLSTTDPLSPNNNINYFPDQYVAWSALRKENDVNILATPNAFMSVTVDAKGWDLISLSKIYYLPSHGRVANFVKALKKPFIAAYRYGRRGSTRGTLPVPDISTLNSPSEINDFLHQLSEEVKETLAASSSDFEDEFENSDHAHVHASNHFPKQQHSITNAEYISFSPIGLIDMLNAGGAVEAVSLFNGSVSAAISMRGVGKFGVLCNKKPKQVLIDGKSTANYTFTMVDASLNREIKSSKGGGEIAQFSDAVSIGFLSVFVPFQNSTTIDGDSNRNTPQDGTLKEDSLKIKAITIKW